MTGLARPIPGARITQRFGENPSWYLPTYRGHEGIDFSAVVGTPVRAAHAGAANHYTSDGYGLYVVVETESLRTVYAHLSEATVSNSQQVMAGQVIGFSGNTGRSTGPHLHFGVCPLPRDWDNGYQGYVDPLPWLEVGMNISRKVGLHVIGSRRVALGQPTIVKWIDPSVGDIASAVAETGTDCLVVVRFYQSSEPLDDPERRADEWVAKYKSKMLTLRALTPNIIFEGYNEVGDSKVDLHARFEIRRMQRLHELGLRAGVGSWGVGHPYEGLWGKYDGMISAMGADDVLCFHEYWRDTADVDNNWHVCRFRYHGIWEHLRGHLIAITEAGRDTMFDIVPQGDAGWKKTCGPDEYLRDLQRLGELYDAIPEVIGATIFQHGAVDPTWKDYEVGEIWPRVVAGYGATVIPPTVTPPVEESVESVVRNAAWNLVDIPYNPDAAFPKYARSHSLGIPMTNEFVVGNVTAQGYAGGIVYAVTGDWANIKELAW